MRILNNEKPPIYEAMLATGLRPNLETTVFAYGDAIYNPSGKNIPEDVIAHEEAHCAQQGDNPDGWWERYLQDPYFRIDQEAEGYGAQYAFLCQRIPDRNKRAKVLWSLGGHLCSPTYGGMIGHTAAMKMIKDKAKNE